MTGPGCLGAPLLVLLLGYAPLLASPGRLPAVGVAQQRLTPADCEQWEPAKDTQDGRLDTPVSVWKRAVSAGDIARLLSDQTGVSLTVAPGLTDCKVTVFSAGRSLRSAMIGLAAVFGGYWVYRRGQVPESRLYCLTTEASDARSVEDWIDERADSAAACDQ